MSSSRNFPRLSRALIPGAISKLAKCCHVAWTRGHMDGLSGNASVRIAPDLFVITASGTCKGRLKAGDFVVLSLSGEKKYGAKAASSEWRLHAAVYAAFSDARAILHTHPANLQALEWRVAATPVDGSLLSSWLYETELWEKRFAVAPEAPLGSKETAENAVAALRELGDILPRAVWLSRHGLCAAAVRIWDALDITEELEHIAKTKNKFLATS
ncbi:MAG: class II aldolase/adducin family protein [Desulfovibrio sp.]|nr:class II aldolase/adducin family protein [Desulfovibrio sp.]